LAKILFALDVPQFLNHCFLYFFHFFLLVRQFFVAMSGQSKSAFLT